MRSLTLVLRRLRGPVLLGLVAVAVVAIVASVVGTKEAPQANLSAPRPQEEATETPVPQLEETEADVPSLPTSVTSYEVFLARDPFEPVIPDPVGGGEDGTGAPAVPVTSPGDGTDGDDGDGATDGDGVTDGDGATDGDGVTDGGGVTDGDGNGDGTGGDGDGSSSPEGRCVTAKSVSCDGRNVSLVDVFTEDGTETAVVRIDDVIYEVEAGEQFASNFVVRSIETSCVTLQYGDDAFTLCEGEAVLK